MLRQVSKVLVRQSVRNFSLTHQLACSSYQQKKLFTPGPLNTSMVVKQAMLKDLGSRDAAFLKVVRSIRQQLVEIAGGDLNDYTCVPIQGTGTYAVESVFQCAIAKNEKRDVLILENGAYGKRMAKICQVLNISHQTMSFSEDSMVDPVKVKEAVKNNQYSMVAVVHSETSSGVINPIDEIGKVLQELGPQRPIYFIDAMSSFGAFEMSVKDSPIDFLVSSANKCLEGVPGFSYVIARLDSLKQCKGNSRSLCLDIYDQWLGLEQNSQFRFTPPTHAMLAFAKALEEFNSEGGIEGRRKKYMTNRSILRDGMKDLGFEEYLKPPVMTEDSYIITSYRYPNDPNFDFATLYKKLSERDFVIYPGKVLASDCFRVGSIGHLNANDFIDFIKALQAVLEDMKVSLPVKYD